MQTKQKTPRKGRSQPASDSKAKGRGALKPGSAKPRTIDEYLARLTDDQRSALQTLRTVIKKVVPQAEECISYQLCAFRQNGMLVAFGATDKHCAFYLLSGSTVDAHKEELKDYDTSKGTIRFQPDSPLPASLVRKLVKARLAENEA